MRDRARGGLRELDGSRRSRRPAHYSWREVYAALECPTPDAAGSVPFDSSAGSVPNGGENSE